MTTKEATEFLDLIVARASGLRDAGVLRVELDGVVFVLAAAEVAPEDGDADQGGDDGPVDVLRDSWTRGVPPRPGQQQGGPASPRKRGL